MFADVLTNLAEQARAFAGDATVVPDNEGLLSAAEELTSMVRRAEALRAAVVAEIDARGSSDVVFGHRTAAWLSQATRESEGSARKTVRVGRAGRRLPVVAGAWAEGRLSLDHVAVLARVVANPRVADHIVGLQELLVDRAVEVPFERWRDEVQGIVDMLDADGGHRPDEPDAPSVLRLLSLFDGSFQLHADLSAADAATVAQALDDEADRLFRCYCRDRDTSGGQLEVPSRPQLMAEALVSLVRKGSAVDLNRTAPLRPEAVVVIRTDTPDVATVGGIDRTVPTRSLLPMLSDAAWRRVNVDPAGEVLDLGRARRLADDAQRRALFVRDGGCVFPGCDAPAHWCDIHHLLRWALGGGTDLHNLVLLCRHHHGVIHRAGWLWKRGTDGHIEWTTPAGHTLVSQRRDDRNGLAERAPPLAPVAG
jgi:hypothetical protein